MHSCLDRIFWNGPSLPRSLVVHHLIYHLGHISQSCCVHVHKHVGHAHSQRALITQRRQRIDVQSRQSEVVLGPKTRTCAVQSSAGAASLTPVQHTSQVIRSLYSPLASICLFPFPGHPAISIKSQALLDLMSPHRKGMPCKRSNSNICVLMSGNHLCLNEPGCCPITKDLMHASSFNCTMPKSSRACSGLHQSRKEALKVWDNSGHSIGLS